EKKAIKKFFQCEYNIDLGHNFEYYNRTTDKLPVLKLIAKNCALYSDAIFIDNSYRHTLPAKAAGFTVFYADNNFFNTTNGTQYIELLELIVTIRAKQRKQPVVNAEDSDDEYFDCYSELPQVESSLLYFDCHPKALKDEPLEKNMSIKFNPP
ncbi:hypothetical protein DA717_15225, partial [Piscirickettsiaceae bacterium NZ-RLO2]